MFPRLGDNSRWLKQHTEESQGRVNLDRVFGFNPPVLGHITVNLFNAALGVLAVPAHVPLAHRTIGAGNRIGSADDAYHNIALLEPACRARVHHAAE